MNYKNIIKLFYSIQNTALEVNEQCKILQGILLKLLFEIGYS